MLFSFLIASVSAGPTNTAGIDLVHDRVNITNRCGVDGAVDHEFVVTLKPPPADLNGRRLDTTEDKLSFLQGWVHQYDPEDTSNGTTRRKLEANSKSTHVMHYFTQTRLAVAIEADKKVRHAPSTRPHVEHPALRVATMLTNPHTNAPGRHAHGQRPGRLLD